MRDRSRTRRSEGEISLQPSLALPPCMPAAAAAARLLPAYGGDDGGVVLVFLLLHAGHDVVTVSVLLAVLLKASRRGHVLMASYGVARRSSSYMNVVQSTRQIALFRMRARARAYQYIFCTPDDLTCFSSMPMGDVGVHGRCVYCT